MNVRLQSNLVKLNVRLLSVKHERTTCRGSLEMSPRPRTVDDRGILEAASRIILKLGPGKFTLADVGREAGLSAATLVQRFGSKRALLLALARSACESVDACFATIRRTHPSPLDALV